MTGKDQPISESFFDAIERGVEQGKEVFALFDASEESNLGLGLLAICDRDRVEDLDHIPTTEELRNEGWSFMTLNYDLKNTIEDLTSGNEDPVGWPEATVWRPTSTRKWENVELGLTGDYSADTGSMFEPTISKEEYLENVKKLQHHIQIGDIYEVNYCIGFRMSGVPIDPASTFMLLQERTRAPFSSFIKHGDLYLLSGSPERYLKRNGNKVVSQPIKGTVKRGSNKGEDATLIRTLRNDPKERSENIMITDLVRNDLSRIATKGSVRVDELCEVYSFKTVHQLISTISCEVHHETNFEEIVRASFPMGSMTGAPKIRAMELIEEYETLKRGLYSGSIGYYTPSGDFDLNVVIRSIQYNAKDHTTLVNVGGAITAKSDPEKEYEECMLKADAMLKSVVTR